MANINKIRVSGTTYNIQDINAPKVIELTQSEYDALTVKDPNAFYVITDSEYNFDGYWTSAQTQNAITQSVSSKADTSAVTSVNDSLTAHTANTTVHVTAQDKTNWNAKSDFSGDYNDLTNKPTIPTVPTSNTAFTNDAGYITSDDITGKTNQSDFTAHTANTTVHVTASEKSTWNAKSDFSGSYDDLSNKPTIPSKTSDLTNDSNFATTGDVQTATNDMATKTWVGQQGYLTEHQSLSNYYTKSETSGATEISTALASKQSTLESGTNIKTINNESILGSGNIDIQGGGKAVAAGTNISVTTGETADTINCTLPMSTDSVKKIVVDSNYSSFVTSNAVITANSLSNSILLGNNTFKIKGIIKGGINNNLIIGSYNTSQLTNGTSPTLEGNLVVGSNNTINGASSLLVGSNNTISRSYQFAIGYKQHPNNEYETSLGAYSVSSSGSSTFGDSGNTLFSVGNGTAENSRHNAFEIRQNGDIYLSSGGTDIKLQDHLGGGGSSYTAGDGIDITNDVISVTGKVDTSAFTAHTADTVIHVTSAEKAAWNAKSDFSGSYNDLTNKPTIPTSASQLTNDTGYITSSALDGYATTATTSALNNTLTAHTADTTVHTTAAEKTSWNSAVTALGGLSLVKLTQSEYDALETKDNSTLYVIVN